MWPKRRRSRQTGGESIWRRAVRGEKEEKRPGRRWTSREPLEAIGTQQNWRAAERRRKFPGRIGQGTRRAPGLTGNESIISMRGTTASAQKAKIVENCGDGLGVAQAAAANHAFKFDWRERARGDDFVLLGLRAARRKPLRQEDEHALREEARRREDIQKNAEAARAVARLFEQLAGGAALRAFARLFAAGDKFPEELAAGVTELPDKHDAPVGQNGEDDDGARMRHNFPGGAQAAGFDHFVAAHGKDRALVNDVAAENARFAARRCFVFVSRSHAPSARFGR